VVRWLPALSPHFQVLVPDLPGCKGVAPLGERHTARAYARHAIRMLDTIGIDQVYAGGLCSGTAIALALAAEAPHRVRGLLLHTPFLRPDLIRPVIRMQMGLLVSPLGGLYAPLRNSTALATLHQRLFANASEVGAAQLAQGRDDLVLADARANRELAQDLLTGDRTEVLRTWRRPVGVLLAAADAYVDAKRVARAVLDTVPHAMVETIAGGHGWTPAFVAAQHAALERLAPAVRGPVG
jgi:pimeloyl-ACP methyl ester carboxylesterase